METPPRGPSRRRASEGGGLAIELDRDEDDRVVISAEDRNAGVAVSLAFRLPSLRRVTRAIYFLINYGPSSEAITVDGDITIARRSRRERPNAEGKL